MIGISDIAIYIPEHRHSNYQKKDRFNLTDDFIENKIGVRSVARMSQHQNTSDLCCKAFENLIACHPLDPATIDVLMVCTQNPDFSLPHTSAIVQAKLGVTEKCAAFDISLGCSGYVYGLPIIIGFMLNAGLKNGLFFTADPYSKIIDPTDKNTSLLFGDAATVTYISAEPMFTCGKFTFGTRGSASDHLICRDRTLHMNGREVFNFTARTIPQDVATVLELNKMRFEDIDLFLLHPGSKFIVDFLIKKIGLPVNKTPFVMQDYGNTVSSSIPIMLKPFLFDSKVKRVLLSGFGVGLSWASGILERPSKECKWRLHDFR